MSYTRTIFTEGDGSSYGADVFNKMDQGIADAHGLIEGGSRGLDAKQNINLAKLMKKLRNGEQTSFCFRGDSIWFAFNTVDADAVEEICTPDNGSPLAGFKRSPITPYDSFKDVMNKVFESNISIKKQIYTGDTVATSLYRWNTSNSDATLILYGINDSVGSHITDSYTSGVSQEIPKGYKGNVEYFIQYYRRVIEKEISGGTCVVLVTPTKQTLDKNGLDIDSRTLIDVYEQAIIELGKEYNCPVINGNILTHDFSNKLANDFCHFTKEGFKTLGYRLAAPFIGQSPSQPLVVGGHTYLGVNPILDNVNIVVPAVLDSNAISPNPPAILTSEDLYAPTTERATGGLCANVTGAGTVVFSFYCEHGDQVIVPCLFTKDACKINVKLDFGCTQGSWSNYWNCISANGTIDRDYIEPTQIVLNSSASGNMTTLNDGRVYGLHVLNQKSQPVLKCIAKGWHTVEISLEPLPKNGMERSDIPESWGDEVVNVFGINLLPLEDYKRKVATI